MPTIYLSLALWILHVVAIARKSIYHSLMVIPWVSFVAFAFSSEELVAVVKSGLTAFVNKERLLGSVAYFTLAVSLCAALFSDQVDEDPTAMRVVISFGFLAAFGNTLALFVGYNGAKSGNSTEEYESL